MKKPPFNQLRGTPAQKYRHRIVLGLSAASFVLSLLCAIPLTYFKVEPGKRANEFFAAHVKTIRIKPKEPVATFRVGDEL